MLNFNFFEKVLGIVSPSHFLYDFQRKIVLITFFLEILGNMCTAVTCFPGFDVMHFEVNSIFLIKPFLHMTKKSGPKFENEKSFHSGIKSVFSLSLKGYQLPQIVSELRVYLYEP